MSKPHDDPPSRPLPLNAIRVFTEAARQLNFSRAGRVLGMTQGGVSRHVATLESFLGLRLFVRTGTAVALTDPGRLYFDAVHEALSTIELATRQWAHGHSEAGRLVVRTSLPTFAMTTLIPALSDFRRIAPVSVDVVTSLTPPAPGDAYDVLVSRDLSVGSAEHWLLGREEFVCVATPARCAEFDPQPVRHWPFLSAQSRPDALADWCRAQGLPARKLQVVAAFAHYFLAIPAAVAGLGHLVVPRLLVADPLRQGLLQEAAAEPVPTRAEYNAYLNPHCAAPAAGRLFCRWLKGWLRAAEEARPARA